MYIPFMFTVNSIKFSFTHCTCTLYSVHVRFSLFIVLSFQVSTKDTSCIILNYYCCCLKFVMSLINYYKNMICFN